MLPTMAKSPTSRFNWKGTALLLAWTRNVFGSRWSNSSVRGSSRAMKSDNSYMLLCAALRASEAIFIVVKTLVFVFALSSASLCISIVDSVPSICCNCFSYRFFRFNAAIAAVKSKNIVSHVIAQTRMGFFRLSDSLSFWHPLHPSICETIIFGKKIPHSTKAIIYSSK